MAESFHTHVHFDGEQYNVTDVDITLEKVLITAFFTRICYE